MPDGGFVISYAEITERRMVEEALHDSEERIRLFANAMPTMMCYMDERGALPVRQPRLSHDLRPQRQAHPRPRAAGGAGRGRIRHAQALYRAGARRLDRACLTRQLPSPDGEPRFGLATYVPHRGADGQVVGFFVLIQDITERRRAAAHPGSRQGRAGAPGL